MHLTDLDLKPKDVGEADWEVLPPGARLRVVRDHQYELELTAGQYEALARLPYWMLYGPEHGAPREWFNPEGFLLPKYRPGGPRFAEFEARRRRYRGRRLLRYLARQRRTRRVERHKDLYAFAVLLGCLGVYVVTSVLFRRWVEGEPRVFVQVLVASGLCAVGAPLLLLVRDAFERRRITRLWAARQNSRSVATPPDALM